MAAPPTSWLPHRRPLSPQAPGTEPSTGAAPLPKPAPLNGRRRPRPPRCPAHTAALASGPRSCPVPPRVSYRVALHPVAAAPTRKSHQRVLDPGGEQGRGAGGGGRFGWGRGARMKWEGREVPGLIDDGNSTGLGHAAWRLRTRASTQGGGPKGCPRHLPPAAGPTHATRDTASAAGAHTRNAKLTLASPKKPEGKKTADPPLPAAGETSRTPRLQAPD
jgi:hypothetical protein